MSPTIDYFFAPQSPWTYLGHARFVAMAQSVAAKVRPIPIDFGKVFPISGGLPLAKRAPQRQAYRLVELKRFGEHLGLPINIQPQHFPVATDDAARLIVAVDLADGPDAALNLTGRLLTAVWAQQRNISEAAVLRELLHESKLPLQRFEQSSSAAVQQTYDSNTQAAIDAGIFGAPTYRVDGEMFWGQDRLDFVERRLRAAKI